MGKMLEIRWHGRGGQGAFTASKLFGEAVALYGGRYALAFPSFGPERRGAPVLAFTKIDFEKIRDRSEVKLCDYIVILDETLFSESYFEDLKPGGMIVLDSSDPSKYDSYSPEKLYVVNATQIAVGILGRPISNTAMLGVLAAISGIAQPGIICNALENYFKGPLLQKNMDVIQRSFDKTKTI